MRRVVYRMKSGQHFEAQLSEVGQRLSVKELADATSRMVSGRRAAEVKLPDGSYVVLMTDSIDHVRIE